MSYFIVAFSSFGAVATPWSTLSLGAILVSNAASRWPPVERRKEKAMNATMARSASVTCRRGGISQSWTLQML